MRQNRIFTGLVRFYSDSKEEGDESKSKAIGDIADRATSIYLSNHPRINSGRK